MPDKDADQVLLIAAKTDLDALQQEARLDMASLFLKSMVMTLFTDL